LRDIVLYVSLSYYPTCLSNSVKARKPGLQTLAERTSVNLFLQKFKHISQRFTQLTFRCFYFLFYACFVMLPDRVVFPFFFSGRLGKDTPHYWIPISTCPPLCVFVRYSLGVFAINFFTPFWKSFTLHQNVVLHWVYGCSRCIAGGHSMDYSVDSRCLSHHSLSEYRRLRDNKSGDRLSSTAS